MSFRKFSAAEDDRLVRSVKNFPILYSHERHLVSNGAEVARDSWRAVAEAVERDEDACKRRWRDIRDHYYKTKKRHQRGFDIKWTLFGKLSFLNEVQRKKRLSRKVFDPSVTDDGDISLDVYEPLTTVKVESASEAETSPLEYVMVPSGSDLQPPSEVGGDFYLDDFRVSTDRRLSLLEANSKTAEEDDVDAFMRSVALTVKRLPPELRAEAKVKILSLVTQLEFPERHSTPKQT